MNREVFKLKHYLDKWDKSIKHYESFLNAENNKKRRFWQYFLMKSLIKFKDL